MKKLALCIAALFLSAPAYADDEKLEQKPARMIVVSGSAERKIVPDEAYVNVTIGSTNMQLEPAKADHDKKLKEVLRIAKDAGINKAQIKTQNSATQRIYEWANKKRTFKGYRVLTQILLTVKDVSSVGELQSKLNALGLEKDESENWGSVINVRYGVSDSDQLRDDILSDAVKNAHKKAEAMAQAAGTSVIGVYRIVDSNVQNSRAYYGSSEVAPAALPMAIAEPSQVQPSIIPPKEAPRTETEYVTPPMGEETINANVTVTFELQ